MYDRKPIHKVAARSAVVFLLLAVMTILLLRIAYYRQKNHLSEKYFLAQEELAGLIAYDADLYISGIINNLRTLSESGLFMYSGGNIHQETLAKILKPMQGSGVLDVVALGNQMPAVSAANYLATTGMKNEEIHTFIMNIKKKAGSESFVSETIRVDKSNKDAGYIILAGVNFKYRIYGREARDESDPKYGEGALVAIISVQELNQRIQTMADRGANRLAIALDRNGYLVSHPQPEFVGSNSADSLYLSKYPDLGKAVERMKQGEEGKADYLFLDNETGKKDKLWHIAFAPVKSGGISAAVAFQHSDIPDIDSLRSLYTGFTLFVFMIFAIGYAVYLRERNRFINLEKFSTRMGDTAAVNELLTTINSEITDEKRSLEGEVRELRSIHRAREPRLRSLTDLVEQIEISLKKPSRAQRTILNDMLKEIKALSRPAENRFRKTSDATPKNDEESHEQ